MNYAIEKLLEIAGKEVGVREEGGNNRGTRVVDYQKATWLAPDAWPWCAAFCSWTMREWLADESVREFLSQYLGHPPMTLAQTDKLRCRDASAFGWEKWAKAQNFLVLPETELAKAGDFVVFDFSHIGIVEKDQLDIADDIQTIEGNTDGDGGRDSENGDGVWRKSRAPKLTKSYLRIFGRDDQEALPTA